MQRASRRHQPTDADDLVDPRARRRRCASASPSPAASSPSARSARTRAAASARSRRRRWSIRSTARAGLALLGEGTPPDEVVRLLTGADAGREHRQLHVLDARAARRPRTPGARASTGAATRGLDDFSVAGNMLAGPAGARRDTARAFEQAAARRSPSGCSRALEAGDAAGGDKRGKQAAALLICTTEDYPALDLRVDDHAEPLRELRRLVREEPASASSRSSPACRSARRPPASPIAPSIEGRIARFQRSADAGRDARAT